MNSARGVYAWPQHVRGLQEAVRLVSAIVARAQKHAVGPLWFSITPHHQIVLHATSVYDIQIVSKFADTFSRQPRRTTHSTPVITSPYEAYCKARPA